MFGDGGGGPDLNMHAVKLVPVLGKQYVFLKGEDRYLMVLSRNWSECHRCMPFLFATRSIKERMTYPFLVMAQPNERLLMEDLKKTIGDDVIHVDNVDDMLEYYTRPAFPSKLVVAVLSEANALELLHESKQKRIPIMPRTRFCLGGADQHRVQMDTLIAELARQTMACRLPIPLHVVMTCVTHDACFEKLFYGMKVISIDDYTPFEVESKSIVKDESAVDEVAAKEA